MGVLRHTLLLPPNFLDKLGPSELDAVLAHEFAHMRRADFAKNLLYGILSLPIAYHPILVLTRSRLAETRELLCDDLAAEQVGGRDLYARSLLRLASLLADRSAPRILHAIGILDANIFERRVTVLNRKNLEVKSARRIIIAIACVLVALATCASALALRLDVADSSKPASPAPAFVNVKSDALTIVHKVPPVYPPDAKKAKITGSVVIAATIGKDGAMENLHVLSGPPALQSSALEAVRQWRYQPFLLNGNPIEVKTTISIIYKLAQ